ncbi:methionine synthase (B12-independent) [Barrientosiimonas humi]|uniref:5-methyltetrahydropteroyltriglutamate--homocysteine methyltransferase n=1 Tax=Barrientosiimonas humi TaxID=999931 RepID=A0A542XCB3_9MICO|nr:5-methyltetrahydropteroyltriglutamate--homocysteine S-methyltransferase [Barrientosiimonas humi]TQL33424.1 methionine synthase (B12-independent) [Barrientosiimonas humi]CAG7573412.1 5-methyltetrahydropteroyltriglutamate--homocysteine methyltransferase [Barrientosiimonas humi]
MTEPFTATVLGLPRIGPKRELKKALEAYWAGDLTSDELAATGRALRETQLRGLADAGLDSVPVGTFSRYDQVLDTAVLLGALPERYTGFADPLDGYFAAARGTDELAPLEMTKWFDTNYHYIVPEISPGTQFSLHPETLLAELAEADALELGVPARPVVLGPVTFLRLSKAVGSDAPLLDRLEELVPLYADLLARLADAGAAWVQIDEPALVTDLSGEELAQVRRTYDGLAGAQQRPAILLATYFGRADEALRELHDTGIEGLAIDLVAGALPPPEVLRGKHVVAGVVDGRNVWRTDPDRALDALETARAHAASVAVSTSCSLLHVPYALAAEPGLDARLRSWLAFGSEKVREVRALADALAGADHEPAELELTRAGLASRRDDPRLHREDVRDRLAALGEDDRRRLPADERRALQAERLDLPLLPTTTIGSYPQTAQIRSARADLRRGRIDQGEYVARMRAEIDAVLELQEGLGLDVLVHGEPERNDMVQFFAERLEGFATTSAGWVQSYGSRCVRPPILFGDVARPEPMTVDWISYASSRTSKPVKGMLTGPVTILAWSFVRDDQPLAASADQVALAIRDETLDLEQAGTAVIQVDEPALRELLPLRRAERPAYLDWAVGAFRLATSGVADATQVHTHLCYSEFGDVIEAIAGLDADVTSIEAARSHMEVLEDLNEVGFDLGVGPGVYDIHSPRVPSVAEIETSLREALRAVPAERLWVNPDCGLKTRSSAEVGASLANLVAAARAVRSAREVRAGR